MSAFWKKDKDEKTKNQINNDQSKGPKDLKIKKVKLAEENNDKNDKKSNKKDESKPKMKAKSKIKAKSKNKDKGLIVPEDKAELISKILIKPMISEAVMNAQAIGKYTFKVVKFATKNEIALAVEALYKVSVVKVNILNYKAQSKVFRGKQGNTKGYKKAIVTLKNGDSIKLFS